MNAKRRAASLLLGVLLAACAGTPAIPTPAGSSSPAPSATPSPARGTPTSPSPAGSSPAPSATPSPAREPYVVVSGDTFAKIAEMFGLTVEDLRAANPSIDDPNGIAIGQVLIIPAPAALEPPPEPLVLEAATSDGAYGRADRHVILDEPISLRVEADRRLAGETVMWELVCPKGPEGVFLDWSSPSNSILSESGTAEATADSTCSSAPNTVSYRARIPSSMSHAELLSPELHIEFGGSGPCPARFSDGPETIFAEGSAPVTTSDGTEYLLDVSADQHFDSVVSIVGQRPGGQAPGWRHELAPCWQVRQAVVGAGDAVYLTLVRETLGGTSDGGGPAEWKLVTVGPEGFRAERALPDSTELERAPNGTVFAVHTDRSTMLAALDAKGRDRPGWPYEASVPSSRPLYAADGTVYLAQAMPENDRIIALGADGRVKAGWPYVIPGELASWGWCPGCIEGWRTPSMAPDGSLYDAFLSGIYVVRPDGRAKPGWPYILPTGTALAGVGNCDTGSFGGLVSAFLAIDGRMYFGRDDRRYAEQHEDLVCLRPDGTLCPGWPVRLPGGWWSESFEFDQGVVTATVVKRCSEYMSVCIRADGTMVHEVQVRDTLSEIAGVYGVTVAALLAANPQITDPSLIHPGDLLTIPGGGSTP